MNSVFFKLFLIISSLFVINGAPESGTNYSSDDNYERLWKQVDEFEKDNLPKSALEKVEEIYKLSVLENNEKQILKSTIYKLKYTNILEENGAVKSIKMLESETGKYTATTNSLMYFLLALMYDDYYRNNIYVIGQRSETQGYENPDMMTWDKSKFKDKIIKNFSLSLDDVLKTVDITEYTFLIEYASESKEIYPTMYDFVAYVIVEKLSEVKNNFYFFQTKNDEKNLTDISYLYDAETFITLPAVSDSLSYNNTAIEVFKKWLGFRLENPENLDALLNVDIKRLDFVKNNLSAPDKNAVWERSIKNLAEKYDGFPEMSVPNYELAKYYNALGAQYDFRNIATVNYKIYKSKAMTILNDILSRYPGSKYASQCINLKNEIEKLNVYFEIEKVSGAGEKIPLRISYTNADSIYLTVLECKYTDYVELNKSSHDTGYYDAVKKISKPVISSKLIKLPVTTDYNEHYTEYLMDQLKHGFYIVFLHAEPDFKIENNYISNSEIFISDLSITSKTYDGSTGYYVFNRNTGKPVEKSKVEVYKQEYDSKKRGYSYIKTGSFQTDKNGYVDIKDSYNGKFTSIRVDVSKGKDFISENTYLYYNRDTGSKEGISINIFTDRAIYRPGQTVYFKAICLRKSNDDNYEIYKEGQELSVDLYDANYQKISNLKLKTNEYGSINGSFPIPLNVLPGRFMISINNFMQSVKVEEYKRPMFEVSMLPVEGEYRVNDSIHVEGSAKTYAGTALTDAKVSYTVVRSILYGPFYRGMVIDSKEIYFGETEIGEDGKFEINFKADADIDEDESIKNYIFYNYTVNVSVTDINGETQMSSSTINVSNRSLSISENIGDVVIREKMDSITINTVNVAGKFVPANVEFEVFKLKEPGLILAAKQWDQSDIHMYTKEEWYKLYPGHEFNKETEFVNWPIETSVYSARINTADTRKIKLENAEKWGSGVYRIVMSSSDKWGTKIKYSKEFVLFSENDKKTPYLTPNFFTSDKKSAQPGDVVTFYLGSSYKDVHVTYNLEAKGKVIKTETIKINSEISKIEIPIEESYRGGISISFMFIKNGRLYTYSQPVTVLWKNKDLDIKFITFRDKTLPGATENWKLKISDYLSKPAEAELMATLYDASLDIFAKNSWNFSVNPVYGSGISWQSYNFMVYNSYQNYQNFYKTVIKENVYSPRLNLFGLFDYGRYYYSSPVMRNAVSKPEGAVSVEMDMAQESAELSERKVSGQGSNELQLVVEDQAAVATGGASETGVQIRSNFAETAFFYPNLVTDANGEISLSFTMPESLTRWNFMGLAHTKDLKAGQIFETLITQKELMVMPNLPRFFRENDNMTISAKINNISDNLIQGTAGIEFFNPETLELLNNEFLKGNSNSVNFSVGKDKNTSVEWTITVPEGLSAVGVRIIADGKTHSDGEERILPVLTNRMLVTESLPLPVRKSGTTKFVMPRLKNSTLSGTLKNYNYTLEFTSNPAWYAVQALPYLMEYPFECSEQTFSRFYANSLATHIANKDPKIKRVFEVWKNTPGTNAFMSNLEKNQELKSVLIEETPWLLEAKDENERKQRLGLLFDLNKMNAENASALKKLRESQLYSGGWPWFKGMPESWYISQHIVSGFGHLDKLGVSDIRTDESTWNMVRKAVEFIDSELERSYNDLKKNCDEKCMEKDNLGNIHIQYLYARSFFIKDFSISSSAKEALDYYRNQSAKYWKDKSFYMQGMIALSLHRFGNSNVPDKIIASLKEHSITNKETGMYWKYDSGYYWYQAPVETQALLIEAFNEISDDKSSVEEMKVWLLKQKQTQDWKTTKATSEAVYALLSMGTDLLAETDIPVIKIGDMTIDAENDREIKTEAGTGYFKKSWDGSLIKPDWGNISVTKKSGSLSWGAVYWQYFEQLDKITEFEETPLKINKKLFVERREGERSVVVPVEANTQLKVGDKVKVRIEIRSENDMEYVHLKDMRASCFEPVDYISGYRYKSGFGYYQAIKDASMNFFIDYLRKGTYVFEYDLVVSQKGNFSNGVTTIQCMYAPEFTSHSEGVRVVVD